MIVQAAKGKDYIVYSRSRHDYRSSPDKLFDVDGGQFSYIKFSYDELDKPCIVYIDINESYVDLLNDYNLKIDKLGIIDLKTCEVFYTTQNKYEDQEKPLVWGTYGKGRKGPKIYKFLKDLETDHLEAILDTESWHINDKYKEEINKILNQRKND